MSFERFWSHELNQDLALQVFTWQHVMLIALGILSVVLTLRYAKAIRASKHEKLIKRIAVGWLFSLEMIYHLHYWTHGLFSVPLHVCSFGAIFSIALLITDSKRVFNFVFFIGVFGGLAALFVPNSLGYTYYNVRYYHYIFTHMSIAIVPIYYYKAYNYRVTVKAVFRTTAFILLLSPLIIYTNSTYDRNYMFVGEKPRVIASLLPEWPYYVFVLFILMVISFFGLYYVSNHWSIARIKNVFQRSNL